MHDYLEKHHRKDLLEGVNQQIFNDKNSVGLGDDGTTML
jgi:hypothetical protein